MKKEKINSPFIFVRRGEWVILCHLLANGATMGNELSRLPHAEYINSRSVLLRLQEKGLITTEKQTYTPEENLLRSIFGEESENYILTLTGMTLVKDGFRLVKKYKKLGVDITALPKKSQEDMEEESS